MRRLPVYFLIDVSESMVGEPIKQVEDGMRSIIQELRSDPYALETVFASVLAFAGKAKVLSPLTELYKFYPPIFPVGGGTSLGNALNFLMDDLDRNIRKTTAEVKGDWKPIIFLFTDGVPTDDPSKAIDRWNRNYRHGCSLIAVSLGNNADTALLGRLTENVLRLSKTDPHSFSEFFRWVTASVKTSSVSVCESSNDEIRLPSTGSINLEKVSPAESARPDENFAVVIGKCQTTGKPYLIKYAKRLSELGIEDSSGASPDDYKLVGAYPIDEASYNELSDGSLESPKVTTMSLIGQPACPSCGNQYGFVVCQCGHIFCAGRDGRCKCPWCGMEGELSDGPAGGMDVTRTRG